jgi:hypothetical protein
MKYFLVALALFVAAPIAAQTGGPYKEISWNDLVPRDWDPARHFKGMDLGSLKDGDPKAMEALELIKQEWANAPTDPSMNGRKVKIPGYVVPLEEKDRAVTEFLLVPYFGACIHVPPPPANQIIHVTSAKPLKNLRVMDLIWVLGEIRTARSTAPTPMGLSAAGYQITMVGMMPYKEAGKAK